MRQLISAKDPNDVWTVDFTGWWSRPEIVPDRTQPGMPGQNGSHEPMQEVAN
ncbi:MULTISPECIES: hypothetical protein [unclassified Actinobaculum]|uniref:hypothetical protein n=1 Tax=unclassified Actinobaculum TaxID=2609299 RepID=UPI0013DDB06D|nr:MULTISPECIES: hypothetical protein [unclassified Actinobaculum]